MNFAKVDDVNIASYLPRGEYLRLMGDIMIMALQNNMTNVSTFMVGPERWSSPMLFEGVFDKPVSHHGISHNQKTEEACKAVMKMDLFYMEQYAYILKRMASIEEVDGSTMLDNTLLHFGTAFGDGASHQYFDIPSVVAGGKNLGINTACTFAARRSLDLPTYGLPTLSFSALKERVFRQSGGHLARVKLLS